MIKALARIFYQMVGKHTIPVTLGLRNIYILPTGYGLLFSGVLTAILIGSINYNNNLGFLLTFLLGSIMLSSLMHTYSMLHGLQLITGTAAPTFAGKPARLTFTVSANGRVRKGLYWACNTNENSPCNVTAISQQVTIDLPTTARGRFTAPPLRIWTEYPTGLFRVWSRIETKIEYFVYPAPLYGPIPPVAPHAATGGNQTGTAAGIDDFQGLQTYQAGDPPGRIHWPAYSRGQGLHIKNFSGVSGGERLLDFNALEGGSVEKKLSILCYHLLKAERNNQSVGVQLPGHPVIEADSGSAHRNRCLRALALFQAR